MAAKRRWMLLSYYLPGALSILRVLVTLWFLIYNPLMLPLRFIQIVELIVYGVYNFTYFKLYSDGVPVISVLAPNLLHGVIVFIFKKTIPIIPLGFLIAFDSLYLVAKSVKANLYPFDIDGEEEEEFWEDEVEME